MKLKYSRRQFLSTASKASLVVGLAPATSLACTNSDTNKPPGSNFKKIPIYRPTIKLGSIYTPHPGNKPVLKYNHDVDIVKFKNRFFAAWNANETGAEDVPGQYNFLSVSDDFINWTSPVRLFTAESGAENPVESDNQWQPNFINWKDQELFCAWCDFVARRVFVAKSKDGFRWNNVEVPNAPDALKGLACAFPTNHGTITSKGTMLFPCSIPYTDTERAIVGKTRYAGVLRSEDAGKTWEWSEPIEAISWSEVGEDPADFGGEAITLWEPMLFEQADGKIGLLIRNSTAQDNPERLEKPHRMLLYGTSSDDGKTWKKVRTVEVDTICSRNYAISGIKTRDSLIMIMNDNNVGIPRRISHDRYFLSLYCSPVSNPDLFLPGPVVQPDGGTAFYPNGFIDNDKLYLAYTQTGIGTTIVSPLPDFSKPFLLPREGRPGLRLIDDIAYFSHRETCLGLVLTEELTRKKSIKLSFDVNLFSYQGNDWPILTLGGKTRQGAVIRAIYSVPDQTNMFQVQVVNGEWINISSFKTNEWNHVEVVLTDQDFTISINHSQTKKVECSVLRKICFGGLYLPPQWPMGMDRSSDIQIKLDTIQIG